MMGIIYTLFPTQTFVTHNEMSIEFDENPPHGEISGFMSFQSVVRLMSVTKLALSPRMCLSPSTIWRSHSVTDVLRPTSDLPCWNVCVTMHACFLVTVVEIIYWSVILGTWASQLHFENNSQCSDALTATAAVWLSKAFLGSKLWKWSTYVPKLFTVTVILDWCVVLILAREPYPVVCP